MSIEAMNLVSSYITGHLIKHFLAYKQVILHSFCYIVLFAHLANEHAKYDCKLKLMKILRADSRLGSGQWEMSLQSKGILHWMGTNLESALILTAAGWLYINKSNASVRTNHLMIEGVYASSSVVCWYKVILLFANSITVPFITLLAVKSIWHVICSLLLINLAVDRPRIITICFTIQNGNFMYGRETSKINSWKNICQLPKLKII